MLLNNKRIFIVEDNLSNRAIAQMLLEAKGAKAAIERWGTDTVSRMRDFAPIDLVILDLMFPDGVSGYDIFDEIRRYSEFDQVPIIAVSAADPNTAIPLTQEKGFAGFIGKPLDFHQFPQQISQIIGGEEIWDTLAQI
jgi:CheY-like chemotaxis protein